MHAPNWKWSTSHVLPAPKGSSRCLRAQRTRGSSAFDAMKPSACARRPPARSTKEGEGEWREVVDEERMELS